MSEHNPPYNSDDEGIEDELDVGEGPDVKVNPDYLLYMDKYQGYSHQPRNVHAKRIVADYIQSFVDPEENGNEDFIANGMLRMPMVSAMGEASGPLISDIISYVSYGMAEKISPQELFMPEYIVAFLENYLFSVPIQRRAAVMMQRLRAINILRTEFITPCFNDGRGPRLLLQKDIGSHLAVKRTLKRAKDALLDFHVHELIEMGAPPQITLRIVFAMLQVGLRVPSLVAHHNNPWRTYMGFYRLNCCLGMLVHTGVRGASVRQLRLSDLSLAARDVPLSATPDPRLATRIPVLHLNLLHGTKRNEFVLPEIQRTSTEFMQDAAFYTNPHRCGLFNLAVYLCFAWEVVPGIFRPPTIDETHEWTKLNLFWIIPSQHHPSTDPALCQVGEGSFLNTFHTLLLRLIASRQFADTLGDFDRASVTTCWCD